MTENHKSLSFKVLSVAESNILLTYETNVFAESLLVFMSNCNNNGKYDI